MFEAFITLDREHLTFAFINIGGRLCVLRWSHQKCREINKEPVFIEESCKSESHQRNIALFTDPVFGFKENI